MTPTRKEANLRLQNCYNGIDCEDDSCSVSAHDIRSFQPEAQMECEWLKVRNFGINNV
jgi:hypothetical protein